jgi:hypothetical protein
MLFDSSTSRNLAGCWWASLSRSSGLHSNDPPPTLRSMSGCFMCDRSHAIHSLVRSESLRNRHLSHNARPAFAFSLRPHRLLTDGANLQWRSDIDAPSPLRTTEYIRHPALPLRTVLTVFWVSVFVGYSGTPTLRRCNPFLHDPKTLKLLVALGLHLVLRFQITTLSEGSASSSAQPLLTIRLGKFHC